MKTKGNNLRVDRFALGLVLFAAPLVLGAKGCNTAVVGDDNHGEAGADTGMTGGDAGTGGSTATGGAPATGGGMATGGSPATGGASGMGAEGGTGGSDATGGMPTSGGSDATGGFAGIAGKAGAAGSSGSGARCGGFPVTQCASDAEYCDFPRETSCNSRDQGGTCKPKPGGCTDQYQPVCGCDGKTYGNACDANMMGVSVASDGVCVGKNCGGDTSVTCDAGAFCDYSVAGNCGRRGDTGTCTALPEACDTVEQPVCGCDAKTYSNECFANMAGVSIVGMGGCNLGSGDTCGGITGAECPSGEYCNFPIETQCGSGDQTGTCELAGGGFCSDVVMEVCGCDGTTYSNACYAARAQTSVASNGPCPTQ